LAADRPGLLARFSAAQAKGDARARQFAGLLERLSRHDTPDSVLAAGLSVLAQADVRGGLHEVKQPVLVLHGAHDRIVPRTAGRTVFVAALVCARSFPVAARARGANTPEIPR